MNRELYGARAEGLQQSSPALQGRESREDQELAPQGVGTSVRWNPLIVQGLMSALIGKTRSSLLMGAPNHLCRKQQFSETPGEAEGSQMGIGSTLRKEGEGSDRYRS